MSLTCGIDWAVDHHDVAVVDHAGVVVSEARVPNDATGVAQLWELLEAAGERPDALTPVAIETSKGLFVATLVCFWSGRVLPSILSPRSRYRDRYRSSRAKSDAVGHDRVGEHLANRRPRPPTAACQQRSGQGVTGA